MYLFCPTCQSQFPAAGRCPRCSSRLLSPGEIEEGRAPRPPEKPPEGSVGGRVAAGCVIALGAHLGMREWAMAALEAAEASAVAVFVTNVVLRLAAGLLGGLVAGAGRAAPFGGGLAVGVAGGFAWLVVDAWPDVTVDLVHIGLTGLVVASTGWASLVGRRVWPPAVVLEEPEDSRGSSLLKFLPTTKRRDSRRPTQWWKVLLSAGLVLGSVVAADHAREGLRRLPAGLLHNFGTGGGSVTRIDFELAILGIVLGTFVAGLNTGAGTRHGLFAGMVTAFGAVLLYRVHGEGAYPALDFLVEHLESDTPSKLILALGSIFFLAGVVGGWMGGQLMPPLRRRTRLGGPA